MTEQRKLRTYVHLPRTDVPNAEYVAFGPGDDLPQWAVDQLGPNHPAWQTDDDEQLEGPPPSTLMGSVYEPGSMISTPEVRVGHPPSAAPRPHRSSGSRPASTAGADRGLAEAERRFGPPPPDDAA